MTPISLLDVLDDPTDDSCVTCPVGTMRGTRLSDEQGYRFLGIPYAVPPVKARRFKTAMAHPGWDGLFDAGAFGPASAQVFDPNEAAFEDLDDGPVRVWAGSEDSLTLNIWKPLRIDAPCPVVVWIHGGANWLESSRLPTYDGAAFAQSGIVFVSFNYRLGIFGFLDLSPIGGPTEAHSNGLTDQLVALEWVRGNIAAFGGDPENVTLMGASAGSMDIGWLLASRRLPAGIKRLVMMSGVGSVVGLGWNGNGSVHDAAEGKLRAEQFLTQLGYADMALLEAASTADILERHAAVAANSSILFDMDTLFYPRVGALCPQDPFAAARHGAAEGLEIIIGFTAYEMGLWLLWDNELDQRLPEWAAKITPHLPDAVRRELPDRYRNWFPNEPETALGMHLLGDAMFVMPSLWMADLVAASGGKARCYCFDWEADARRRALHAADQSFLFRHASTSVSDGLLGPARDGVDRHQRMTLEDDMHSIFTAFAREGSGAAELGDWPQWTTAGQHLLTFGTLASAARDTIATRHAWWTANVLPKALGGGA